MKKQKFNQWLQYSQAIVRNDKRFTTKFTDGNSRMQEFKSQVEQIKKLALGIDYILSWFGTEVLPTNFINLYGRLQDFILSAEASNDETIQDVKPKLENICNILRTMRGATYDS